MFRRQGIGLVLRIIREDLAGHQAAQPLTDVSLVEAGRVGDLFRRRRLKLVEHVEQVGAVTYRDQESQAAGVQNAHQLVSKRFGLGVVKTGWIKMSCVTHDTAPVKNGYHWLSFAPKIGLRRKANNRTTTVFTRRPAVPDYGRTTVVAC